MIYILRISFFLLVFLFHSFVFSEPIIEVSEKAKTVFTNFVIDLLSEVDSSETALHELTESGWLENIARDTENWTGSEARGFLDILQSNDISPRHLLNILLSTNYLKVIKEKPAFRFSTESARSERLTAGEVFFNYVDSHLDTSEIEDRMGSEWLTLILTHTQNWTIRDATDFLNFLEASGVQLHNILSLLQATDYLQKLKSGQIDLTFLNSSSVTVIESPSPAVNQQPQNTVSQSAGDIFIERAKQYFRTEFEEQQDKKYKNMTYEEAFKKNMGSNWENKIREDTKSWTAGDATAFLDYLASRIGQVATLNRIKSTSYFKELKYNHFLELVKFYKNYIGEDGVTYRLGKSLNGFHRGDPLEIERVIEFLKEYLGSLEILQEMMMKNLGIFFPLSSSINAQTNLANVKDVIGYLENINITEEQIKFMIVGNFTGFLRATCKKLETKRQLLTNKETIGIAFTHDEINKMIVENIEGFLLADLRKVKTMVTYLKDIGFKDEQIKKMAIRNLQGLAKDDPEILKDKRESLTTSKTIGIAFIYDEINKMIVENIQGFLQVDLRKVKKMVTSLKEIGFKDEQIKKMAIRNLLGLATGDPKTVKSKKESLTQKETIGIIFTNDEINKMITENIKGFLLADLRKVKTMVAYLKEIGFEDEQIKKMAIRNLTGLATGDPKTLKNKKESLTQARTIGVAFTDEEINKMIIESIQNFLQTDLRKVKVMVAYLKDIEFEDDQIKEMAIRNLRGLATGDPKTLENKKESLTQKETIGISFTNEEINKMIENSIEHFLQAGLNNVKTMVAYLKEIGFKDEQIKKMAIRNLKGLAKDDPEILEDKRESLTISETIGIAFTYDEINKMIVESIEGFLLADLKKVKAMVAYLKDIVEDEQIKKMAIRNLQGLEKDDPEVLEDKRESLTTSETIGIAFTYDEINQMIVESIKSFLLADLKKVKAMVAYLKEIGFEDEQVKEMAIRNLKGLAINDPKTLENKKESLTQKEAIGIAFTNDEINQMIVESIEGFLLADLRKVKAMVTYLKDIGFKDKHIKEMAIRNLLGFFSIKSYELKNMIKVIKREPKLMRVKERTLMTKIKEMIITQNLNHFYYNFEDNLKALICTQALSFYSK